MKLLISFQVRLLRGVREGKMKVAEVHEEVNRKTFFITRTFNINFFIASAGTDKYSKDSQKFNLVFK